MNAYTTNTAKYVLQETNWDINKIKRFADVKHVLTDDIMDAKTIIFNDQSYITIMSDDSIIHGVHHDEISLNESIYTYMTN